MNRKVKIIVSIVLCVWIFAMGTELGAYRERKAINSSITSSNTVNTSQQPQIQQTTPSAAPTVQQPVSESQQATQPTQQSDNTASTSGNANDTSNTSKADASDATKTTDSAVSSKPSSKEEIAAAFNAAMNKTKNMTQNCNATKTTNVQINVVDCSVPSLLNQVNSIVQGFTGEKTTEYAFTNGVTSDGKTILSELPPSGIETSITADGITVASCDNYGDGGYTYTLTLVSETGSLDVIPPYHSVTVGYLDIASLDIPIVSITKADMSYPGATVTINVNKDGLIDSYDCKFPMTGNGEAKIGWVTGTASFEGSMDETWTFNWQ